MARTLGFDRFFGTGGPVQAPQAAPAPLAMPAGQPAAAAAPVSQAAATPKAVVFGDYFLSPGQREARKVRESAGAEAAKAGMVAGAQQAAQTRGHEARRRLDQSLPPGQYVERIDPATGDRSKVWTGGRTEVELGREPANVADLRARVASKALAAASQGLRPEQALNPIEKEIYDSTFKGMGLEDFFKVLAAGQAPPAAAPGQPAPASPPGKLPPLNRKPPEATASPAGLAAAAPGPGRPGFKPGQTYNDGSGLWRVQSLDASGNPVWEKVR